MASELSLQSVRQFLLDKGGTVRNKDIARHFRQQINDPATKEDARERFKEYVRVLCSIKESDTDKLLVLKSRFLASSDLPYDATSSELRRKASASSTGEPQLDLDSPAQDLCAQAIASARAIQEGFQLNRATPVKPKRTSATKLGQPKFLLGEFGVLGLEEFGLDTTEPGDMIDTGLSGENGSRQEVSFDEVPYNSAFGADSLPEVSVTCASPPPVPPSLSSPPREGGSESPSLLTQIDSMLGEKFPELQRGKPSKLIKERAEAMAKNRTPSPIERHDLSQVMVSVAARAAALAEKADDSDEEEESKRLLLQQHAPPTKDRMAATVLNLGEPIVPMTMPPTDVPDGGIQSVFRKPEVLSTTERKKALLGSFQNSSSLQETVKSGVPPPTRPRARTVNSGGSPLAATRSTHATNAPSVGVLMSPFLRNTQGPRASLQTRIRKKDKDSKDGAKQESLRKQERKESVKPPGMNGGSDGEESPDDDEQGFEASHVVLDPIEREWLLCSSTSTTHSVQLMLQRDASLANKKDFINTGLHWAAKTGNESTLKVLLEFGADVQAKTEGQTALHLAAKHGRDEIVFTLIEDYSADINARDYAGRQARDVVKETAAADIKEMLGWKETVVIKNTLLIDGPGKSEGNGLSDMADVEKPPTKAKPHFGSSILRASLRRLKGSKEDKKKMKPKPKISILTRPDEADWVKEASPIRLSASEGDLYDVS